MRPLCLPPYNFIVKVSSLKYRFFWFHKAHLVLHRLLEQDIVLRNDSLVTEACHLVLVRGDQPKENTQLFTSTSLYKKYIIPSETLVSPCSLKAGTPLNSIMV